MVFELPVRRRRWLSPLIICAIALVSPGQVVAEDAGAGNSKRMLENARTLFEEGNYFKAARYAFSAAEENSALRPEAYAWITLGLVRSGLYQSASYFFLRTLQTEDSLAIRKVLDLSDELIQKLGPDLLKSALMKYTRPQDYREEVARAVYVFSLAKGYVLSGNYKEALTLLDGFPKNVRLTPYAYELAGASRALLGDYSGAIESYRKCAALTEVNEKNEDLFDLHARCLAGQARLFYEQGQFDQADRVYDQIPKTSFVWTEILFEQAWSSFAQGEYNRTLGKLVTYNHPMIQFVFNSEIEVLRAQTHYALCAWSDALEAIAAYDQRYAKVGLEIKQWVDSRGSNLKSFYDLGKKVVNGPLHTASDSERLMNRFIRAPYFRNLLNADRDIDEEWQAIKRFDSLQTGVEHRLDAGFPGFLRIVLDWRRNSIATLGGGYVKNNLIDYHTALLNDYDKISFIKLELLKKEKSQVQGKKWSRDEKDLLSQTPHRRDDQYYWEFNGEFWADELGDYVFALESSCKP